MQHDSASRNRVVSFRFINFSETSAVVTVEKFVNKFLTNCFSNSQRPGTFMNKLLSGFDCLLLIAFCFTCFSFLVIQKERRCNL